jgi:preprotein translocase subunit SecE
MKTVNKICRILVAVFGLASLVLFFTDFATIISGGKEVTLVGAQLAFGSKITFEGNEYGMAKSAHILLCFILTAVAFLMSIFAHKSKKLRYAISGIGIVTSVYMLVIALAKEAWSFVDVRPLPDVTRVDYTSFVLIAAIAILVFTILAIAYLLIDDYIEVAESKGAKLTIPKRIVRFFRDYKSEVKKIVWPGYKEVIKNTVIVLIMCLIIGLLIWAVDFGLGQLVQLILGTKS